VQRIRHQTKLEWMARASLPVPLQVRCMKQVALTDSHDGTKLEALGLNVNGFESALRPKQQ